MRVQREPKNSGGATLWFADAADFRFGTPEQRRIAEMRAWTTLRSAEQKIPGGYALYPGQDNGIAAVQPDHEIAADDTHACL